MLESKDRTALVFVLYQWWGLWQDTSRLWRIGKDRGSTRYKHVHKGRPTGNSARNTECFLKPLRVAPRIKLGSESTSYFHQRGNWLQLIEANTTDKGAEQCTLN